MRSTRSACEPPRSSRRRSFPTRTRSRYGAPREAPRAVPVRSRRKVKQAGLWAPHLPEEYGGMGLGFLEHAYMNEVLAYEPVRGGALRRGRRRTPATRRSSSSTAPRSRRRSGSMPLIDGEMRVGLLDDRARPARLRPALDQDHARVRDGDDWVINGHKWFTSNGQRADFFIVMCRTEEDDGAGGVQRPDDADHRARPTRRASTSCAASPVWGREHGDHCEIIYDNVRVPLANQLGRRGTRPPGRAGPPRRRARLPLHELGRARCGAPST